MTEFVRLDSVSESVLRAIAQKPASAINLSFVTSTDVMFFGEPMSHLLKLGYIKNNEMIPTTEGVNIHDTYGITLTGKSYLENIDRLSRKEKWQRNFNYFNAAIATIALIKSFLPEIISAWKLLMK